MCTRLHGAGSQHVGLCAHTDAAHTVLLLAGRWGLRWAHGHIAVAVGLRRLDRACLLHTLAVGIGGWCGCLLLCRRIVSGELARRHEVLCLDRRRGRREGLCVHLCRRSVPIFTCS